VGGVIALTWLVFQVGAAIAHLITSRDADDRTRPALASLGVVVIGVVVAGLAPSGSETGRTLGVAVVQGGGEQGTRALDVPSRIVTERHLEATRTIEPSDDLDMVVWPENAINVDLEPFAESDEYEAVAAEAARLGVPFVVGVTVDSEFSAYPVDDSFVNAQVVVAPDGEIVSAYEKVQIVPFGEYVPLRGPLDALGAPLENVPSDATRGQDPAIVSLPDGTELGVMISWEVFFADRARAGADGVMLLNPTNGASYTWTILQTQQVASSLLRASETGRWVVQSSPTGFSAFVSPDGEVFERTDVGEQSVIAYDVPERVGSTWYSTIGDWPWRLLVVLVLALASWRSLETRRRITDDEDALRSPDR
jgi:apolipoprotein N-acyltransferase